MEEFNILLEIVNDLLEKGYTIDFNLGENISLFQKSELAPADFEIDEVYIVEDETDTGVPLLLFAISSRKYQVKGIVLNVITKSQPESIIKSVKKTFRSFFKKTL